MASTAREARCRTGLGVRAGSAGSRTGSSIGPARSAQHPPVRRQPAGLRLTADQLAWSEEILDGITMDGTYNAEQEMKGRGALYEKTPMPCASNVVVDGRLPNGAKTVIRKGEGEAGSGAQSRAAIRAEGHSSQPR